MCRRCVYLTHGHTKYLPIEYVYERVCRLVEELDAGVQAYDTRGRLEICYTSSQNCVFHHPNFICFAIAECRASIVIEVIGRQSWMHCTQRAAVKNRESRAGRNIIAKFFAGHSHWWQTREIKNSEFRRTTAWTLNSFYCISECAIRFANLNDFNFYFDQFLKIL